MMRATPREPASLPRRSILSGGQLAPPFRPRGRSVCGFEIDAIDFLAVG
jgi:hypothetical protein